MKSYKEHVIFDLDGTLCDISHRLHFIKDQQKDWKSFNEACVFDSPKPDMIGLFHALDLKYVMWIVSGRMDTVRDQTLDWLNKHNIVPYKLIMRKNGDYTPDDDLKRSWLYDGTLPNKDDILMAIDDRARVVDMWRKEGITCLQCEKWEE